MLPAELVPAALFGHVVASSADPSPEWTIAARYCPGGNSRDGWWAVGAGPTVAAALHACSRESGPLLDDHPNPDTLLLDVGNLKAGWTLALADGRSFQVPSLPSWWPVAAQLLIDFLTFLIRSRAPGGSVYAGGPAV